MKILLIVLAVISVIAIVGVIILNHPCFGRRMSKERKARIEASPNWHNGQFQNQIPTPQFTGDKSMFGALWEFLTDNKKDRANIHLMPDDLEKAILDLQAKQVFTVHHDKFSLAPHAWTEPDSVAHDIAGRNSIRLLDQPIGTGTKDPDPQEPQEPHQQPVHRQEMSFLASEGYEQLKCKTNELHCLSANPIQNADQNHSHSTSSTRDNSWL